MIAIDRKLFIAPVLILICYLSHFFILGQDTYILISDNLDSGLVWFKTIAEQNAFFAKNSEPITLFANMPRLSFGANELNVMSLLYAYLSPFNAFVINSCVIHFVAFVGMFLLLRNHVSKPDTSPYLIVGVSLCFALLPFWPGGGLSVAGMPLALNAFLNIKAHKSRYYDWITIVFIPFYSSLILSFFAFIGMLGLIFIYDFFKTKKFNGKYFFALVALSLLFLLTEYRQVLNFIDPIFISHRTEFQHAELDLRGAIYKFVTIILRGQYHAASLHYYIILPFVSLAALTCLYKKNFKDTKVSLIIYMGVGILITSLVYGFWNYAPIIDLKEKYELIRVINFSRVHFLHALFWFLIFFLALEYIWKARVLYSKYIVGAVLFSQVIVSFYFSHFAQEYRDHGITYRQFFAQESFASIKQDMSDKEARVISIGLHPTIAQFNNLKTADFYSAYYPLSYKKKFKTALGSQIDESDHLLHVFDDWGSRVYYNTVETGRDYVAESKNEPVEAFKGDKSALKDLNIKYVISRVPIENGLKFINKYDHEDSAWTLYLYSIE